MNKNEYMTLRIEGVGRNIIEDYQNKIHLVSDGLEESIRNITMDYLELKKIMGIEDLQNLYIALDVLKSIKVLPKE